MSDKKLLPTNKRNNGLKATDTAIANALMNGYFWFNYPMVKNDTECAERLNLFFQRCAETGELPTVEKMALALGVNRKTVYNWETGVSGSPERQEMIIRAKELIAAMDAELAAKQKISPVVYIFRAKNFYGMKDQSETVVTHNKAEQSAEAIQSRYEVIDVDFKEDK